MADEKRMSIGALWVNTSKNNKKYLAGQLQFVEGGPVTKIIVFKNDKKEAGSKHPDYRIFEHVAQKEKKEDAGGEEI